MKTKRSSTFSHAYDVKEISFIRFLSIRRHMSSGYSDACLNWIQIYNEKKHLTLFITTKHFLMTTFHQFNMSYRERCGVFIIDLIEVPSIHVLIICNKKLISALLTLSFM